MLTLDEEKHVLCFDDRSSFYSSYLFTLQKTTESEEAEKNKNEDKPESQCIDSFFFEIKINHTFSYEWKSSFYNIEHTPKQNLFGSCPLSLQNYLEYYQDPKIQHFRISLNPSLSQQEKKNLYGEPIGKLIVKTTFKGNFVKLPINIIDRGNSRLNIECFNKTVRVIAVKSEKETIVCSAPLLSVEQVEEMASFSARGSDTPKGFVIYLFSLNERIQSQNVLIAKGKFSMKELSFDKTTVRIYSKDKRDIFFMQGLMQHMQILKIIMGQIEPLVIFQHVETNIEDAYRTVFYADSASLFKRIYRSYLYDKIADRWIIEGMVNYNRNNKHFQDVMKELIDLMSEGEQISPLQDDTFSFDPVWKLKAIFLYHILSNFKTQRDYGSSSLANLIIEESRKKKITSQILFKRLKNKYGLKNFRTIYELQFVKSTGLNRIFYQIIDLNRQNRVKILVRQKSLANKVFRLYNYYRVKLQQEFDLISDVTTKIMNKNNMLDKANKKKEFSGPLAVPKFLKCLPYFKGTVSVETDASETPFELELREENIIEEKQNVTSKIRAPIRKIGEAEKSYEGFGWIMIDTAHSFPAVYKNQNVNEKVILEKIKKRYDSEHQQIKMLNCISGRDHSSNQKICRALIEKVKININPKQNCTINVKRKILQILPIFLSKATDFSLWEDMLSFLKLYEPVCHDFSEEGFSFLLSLIESIGEIQYKKQFGYYFEHFHKIMLKILRTNNFNSEEKELKLKKALFNSLMRWKSCFSLEILEQVEIELKLSQYNVRTSLQTLKIIFKNVLEYIKSLKLTFNVTAESISKLLEDIIRKDITYELFGIKYQFELEQLDQQMPQALNFLKTVFMQLQTFKEQSIRKYSKALEVFKDILSKNRRVYGLEIQLNLRENENFFIAQYLWKELTSPLASSNHFIRLQWIKIYRVFYFYHVPIITLKKIKNNQSDGSFKQLDPSSAQELLQKLRSFIPDIKWFSGYDSRSAKELKAKYEQMNENKRKKKVEEYNFSQNNVITLFIRQHPGRQSWDQLAREAIRTFISIYEDKEQKSENKEAERNKQIQQGFKKIQQKLKRGRMPEAYSYEQLKQEVINLMAEFDEDEEKITDILAMVDKALFEIAQEKAKRQAELKDQMKIVISFDSIREEGEEEEDQPQEEEGQQNQANQQNQEEDDELLFKDSENGLSREEPQMNMKQAREDDADEDIEMFGF